VFTVISKQSASHTHIHDKGEVCSPLRSTEFGSKNTHTLILKGIVTNRDDHEVVTAIRNLIHRAKLKTYTHSVKDAVSECKNRLYTH